MREILEHTIFCPAVSRFLAAGLKTDTDELQSSLV
jgi:hypothetical protein